jgi:hypothetical protein
MKVCKACNVHHTLKANHKKYGLVPPKAEPELIPWHKLFIDLPIGPYPFGNKEKEPEKFIQLHCMTTMIDPATGWFKIVKVSTKQADYIANLLEFN